MIFTLFLAFVSFPDKKDAILQKNLNLVQVESSGSLGYYYQGKCHMTTPNMTLVPDEKIEWCSNIAKSKNDTPWISYSLKNKQMKITGYSLRNGCCYYECCCCDNSGDIDGHFCCCDLYSFSLHGSNDNKTWEIIHSVKAVKDFYLCKFNTYEFSITKSYRYIKLVQDEPYPNCLHCMSINQIEFYGEVVNSLFDYDVSDDDNDEPVSIIGKINRNEFE